MNYPSFPIDLIFYVYPGLDPGTCDPGPQPRFRWMKLDPHLLACRGLAATSAYVLVWPVLVRMECTQRSLHCMTLVQTLLIPWVRHCSWMVHSRSITIERSNGFETKQEFERENLVLRI